MEVPVSAGRYRGDPCVDKNHRLSTLPGLPYPSHRSPTRGLPRGTKPSGDTADRT